MRLLVIKRHQLIASALSVLTFCYAEYGAAQDNGGGNQGGGGQQNQFPGGITISPEGVIAAPQAQRINPALEQKRLKALAAHDLPSDMNVASELRYVSLVRLERECEAALDAGREIRQECRYLAGVTQLQYLFFDEASDDVIIAGPAEGFAPFADGRMVGVETGRPVLTLEDLLVMLRLKSLNQQLGCSFDPNPERLANAQAFNRANSSPATLNVARQRFFQMAQVLGNWDVTVFGLPPTSHAAVTTVEADFRLKRIALGLDRPQIRGFKSHLDLAVRNENTMRRWWFAPLYDVIERSPDGNAFHIAGPRLQLLSQEELVDLQGNRSDAAFTEISADRFTKQFNKHMLDLCRQVPGFAATQNLFDLAVLAALLQSQDIESRINWPPGLFRNDSKLPLQTYNVPQQVPSQVNVKSLNRSLLIGLIGGGVTIRPKQIISRTTDLAADRRPKLQIPPGKQVWWWD